MGSGDEEVAVTDPYTWSPITPEDDDGANAQPAPLPKRRPFASPKRPPPRRLMFHHH